jgi:hypothetical protein
MGLSFLTRLFYAHVKSKTTAPIRYLKRKIRRFSKAAFLFFFPEKLLNRLYFAPNHAFLSHIQNNIYVLNNG